MAKTFFDMTLIPADKIRKILEEAIDGCFETFNKVMEKQGVASGMLPEEFTNKTSRNVMLEKHELLKAFTDLEMEWHHHHEHDYHHIVEKIAALIRKMMEQFVRITTAREAAISDQIGRLTEEFNTKLKAIEEKHDADIQELVEKHDADIQELVEKHDADMERIAEKHKLIDRALDNLDNRVRKLEENAGGYGPLEDKILSMSLDIKLLQQALQEGTQSHGFTGSVNK